MAEPYLTPGSTKVKQIINSFATGHIMVPELQRGVVWKPKKVVKLLDSLYQKLPIPSLILWKSDCVGS